MKLRNFGIRSLGAFTLMILGSQACSHVETEKLPENADPDREISRLEIDYRDAYTRQLDVLAPTYYQKAGESLRAAKEYRIDQKLNGSILEKVGEGRAYLKKCNEVGSLSDPFLKEVLQARSDALAAQAPVFANKKFTKAEYKLNEIARKLENNSTAKADKNREKLKAMYLNIELEAIKRYHLDPSRRLIKQAIREGAEKEAPITLNATQSTVNTLDSFITVDRHNQVQIQEQAKQAKDAAEKLVRVTQSVKNGKTTEAQVLIQEEERRQQDLKKM